MTPPAPSKPDFDRLRAIGAEAERLREEGKWTKAEFDRLFAEATEAAAGHDEFLEFLILRAKPDWA